MDAKVHAVDIPVFGFSDLVLTKMPGLIYDARKRDAAFATVEDAFLAHRESALL